MSSSISGSFTPDFSNIQTPVDNGSKSSGKPAKPGQNQGSTGAAAAAGNGSNSYASLQGAQTTPGQNINATLGQTLGATQGSITDSNSTEDNNTTQSTNTGNTTPIANTGLSTDQQVTGRQGSKGQGSEDGSGNQSQGGQDIYLGTAASGLQKGQGTQSSTSTSSIYSSSNFTLKVDTSEPTSSTSSTSSTTSYVDSNGAPSLPDGPNVFELVAETGELSSTVDSYTVSSMVAANKGMNNILSQKYATEITDIQKYVAAKNSANSKSSMAKGFSWAVNITMIVVGCLTADPMLVGAGIAGCIMTADPGISNKLAGALATIMPKQAAGIVAQLIIVAAACVATGGVAAAGELAADTTTVAARAAISAAEDSAEDGGTDALSAGLQDGSKASGGDGVSAENQTEDLNNSNEQIANNEAKTEATSQAKSEAFSKEGTWSDWSKDAVRFKNAMNTPEGRAAFQASIEDQMSAGLDSTWKNISKMSVTTMVDNALNSMQSGAKSLSDSMQRAGESIYNAGASAMKVAEDPLEAMNTQLSAISKVIAKLAGRSSEEDDVVAETATSPKEPGVAQKAKQSVESLCRNLTSMEPSKMIQIAAQLAMPALSTAQSVMQYDAAKFKKRAMDQQASEIQSKGATTDITEQMSLANAQINQVLGDMNAAISSAGNALSNMSRLSAETTGQLHGAAA